MLPGVRTISCIFFLTLLFACAPPAGLAQAAQAAAPAMPAADLSLKNVLVLNALESNVPLSEATSRGIRKMLDPRGVGIRNQFFENLDLVRNPGAEHRILMADFMRQRYRDRRIDLVALPGGAALRAE